MADFTGNYCWVKVVDLDKEDPEEVVKSGVVLRILGPDRPPKVRKGWQLDKDYDGSNIGSLSIERQPMGTDRDEAIKWLASGPGKTWLGKYPVTYFLACFGTETI